MLNKELFPAFCAHRGLSALLPENSLPAFGAACALAADELELDIRMTADGQLIVSHDEHLERITGNQGLVSDYTLCELQGMRIGGAAECYAYFTTPEEIFQKFGKSAILNLHVKECGEDGRLITKALKLIGDYHLEDSVYFAGSPDALLQMQRLAPGIRRCAIQLPRDTMPILEAVERFECFRAQLWLGMFDQALIQKLHDHAVQCNLYYADTPQEIRRYFEMGIDVILTNRMDIAAAIRKGAL